MVLLDSYRLNGYERKAVELFLCAPLRAAGIQDCTRNYLRVRSQITIMLLHVNEIHLLHI